MAETDIAQLDPELIGKHAILFYGYDSESEILYATWQSNGSFHEKKVTYNAVRQSFDSVRHEMTDAGIYPYEASRFNYPVTVCAVKWYSPPEFNITDLYWSLRAQKKACGRVGAYVADGNNNYGDLHWDGIPAIHNGLLTLMYKMYHKDPFLDDIDIRFSLGFKKVSEHWNFLIQTIQVFAEAYRLDLSQDLLRRLKESGDLETICYKLAIKYEKLQEPELLLDISDYVSRNFHLQMGLLDELIAMLEALPLR